MNISRLVHGLNPAYALMDCKPLKSRIGDDFIEYKQKISTLFSNATIICLTADIWSCNRRSFLGITAHWIEVKNDGQIERKSAAIACKRFKGIFFYSMIS